MTPSRHQSSFRINSPKIQFTDFTGIACYGIRNDFVFFVTALRKRDPKENAYQKIFVSPCHFKHMMN